MKDNARLAIYTDYLYGRSGSGEVRADRAFALFAGRLAGAFERVIAIGRLDPTGEAAKYPIGERVEFVELPFYPALTNVLAVLSAMARSVRVYWRVLGEVDVVWLLGPHPLAVVFALIALARRRRVVLGVRQDMVPYMKARRPGQRGLIFAAMALEGAFRSLGRVCPVVVVGPTIARNYRHSKAVLDVAISLIPGADVVEPSVALARDFDGTLKLLAVGRLDPEKNPLILADILAALNAGEARWRLIVCGEGSLEDELAARLEQLGAAGHAELRGYVPNDQGLGELYRSSHAFLHVSWTEGLPQVLLEALAAGLPTVATDVGGVGEAIGDAALHVPPGDPAAAVAALRRVAAEAELREGLIHAGHAYVSDHTAEVESRRVARFLRGEPAP
jgi:glycosyltransferase involved in cell wall biosynthesis